MLVHIDGFDSYTTYTDLALEYGAYNWSYTGFSTTAGRYGAGGVQFAVGHGSLIRTLPSVLTEAWFGCALYPTQLGDLFLVSGPSGAEFSVTTSASSMKFYRGNLSSLVSTVGVTLATNAWHWYEFHYKYSATVGVVEVWVDGVQVAAYSGNTTSAGGGGINTIAIGYCNAINLWGTLDDLYILDATIGTNTTRLGDSRIETLVPTGNGATDNGAASAGSNYACVNDATWNTTNYVTIPGTTGQEELYEMSNLTSSAYVVYGARAMAISQKSDAGPSLLRLVAVSGGTEGDSAGIPTLCGSWSRQYSIYETDPHTSAAWTAAAVNAMQAGVKVA